jgi:hypothetical protein
VLAQSFDHLHEVRKPAAETSSSHFTGLYTVQGGKIGIHQRFTLVVEDESAAQPAPFQLARRRQQEGGFAGA